ncbi:MAG: starch synthase [Candidatus Peregrinibacteria bacterium Greene0416_19]|nr:MAG: starch synthase [Candidatus Peregrinibacteria bacterium Greene0416_19]
MPTGSYSPAFDAHITRKYSVGSLEHKIQNKTALQEEIGWPAEPKRPLVCLPAGMTDALGGPLFKEILAGLLTQPVELLVLGKGSTGYGTLFTQLATQEPHRVHIVQNEEHATRRMYAAADMALFLSDVPIKELTHCLAYGAVPLSLPQALLENYDPVQETGNSFLYDKPTVWHAFSALVRAMETYKFPFDWRTIQRHAMESVR